MATRTTSSPRTLVAIVVGITVMVALMLLAFAAPALNSGPKDLPLAVSGPEQATSKVTAALDKQAPGTFDVTTYATEQEGAEAITDREAIGGITVGAKGVTVQTATGAGTAYTQVLKGVGAGLEESGQKVTYVELAPTTTDDPQAVGVSTLGLPLVFGGMATAALLLLVYRGSTLMRFVGATAIALLAGFVATAILQLGFGALDGDYWLTSLSISAGILAISATVLGLGALVGAPGIGIGAVTMLFVANPLSGLANGPQWLPGVWGEVGQLLPVGAAGSLVRSVAFFDGGGAISHLVVLAVWIVLGVALAGLGVARQGRGTHVATAEREEALASA
ncbi:ABC transporter permease [Janibacter sp. G349]|uniref:ABC transporter permease n=1 Tax=Janibacter sp. G349 TaxID=3405424 RepID=UPI003B804F6A